MSKHFVGKYFLIGLLSTLLAGPVAAQSAPRGKRKPKTELPANDTTKTLTHSTPIPGVKTPPKPKRKKFLIGHADDSYQLGIGTFLNMSPDNNRAVFIPNVTIKPFVRICDNYMIGVHANAIVQNYGGENFLPVVNEMYLYTSAQTKIGRFDVRVGKMAAINYPVYFMGAMPVSNFLLHRVHFDSRRYLPRAAIGTFNGQDVSLGLGYTEFGDGFGFTGNGYVIMTAEQRFSEGFQIGGFVLTNRRESYGDIYIACQPTNRDALMLQLLSTGNKPIFYGLYRHTLKSGEAAIAINGFAQKKDGASGADISFQHIKTGTYVSAGAHYNDPLHITPDTPAKWQAFVQVGINKTLAPKR